MAEDAHELSSGFYDKYESRPLTARKQARLVQQLEYEHFKLNPMSELSNLLGEFRLRRNSMENHLRQIYEVNFLNGSKYVGEMENGEMNGLGKFSFASSASYEGAFSRNEISGNGEMLLANSVRYVGEFHKNKRHGKGVLELPNGTYYSGTFKESLPCGKVGS